VGGNNACKKTLADDAKSSTGSIEEAIMKRQIAAGLSILAVTAGVGWKLASHPETSAGLQEISLSQHSEHSHPGPTVTAHAG
jgi:hypothetical protein